LRGWQRCKLHALRQGDRESIRISQRFV